MYRRRALNRKKRAPRRRPRQARIGPPRAGLQLKTYDYTCKLLSQVITSTSSAGQMLLSTTGGQAPVSAGSFALGASSNGLSGFFDLFAAVPFQLNDLVHSGTYTSMYDAYKIKRVSVSVEYLTNNTSQFQLNPTTYMVWDQDDAIIPPTLASITSKQGVSVRQFGNKSRSVITYSMVPTISQVVVYNGGTTGSGGVASKPTWLDSRNPDVQHNAFKLAITDIYLPGGAGAVEQAFRLNWTYHMCFRSPLLSS